MGASSDRTWLRRFPPPGPASPGRPPPQAGEVTERAAASRRTSSISRARCARPGIPVGPGAVLDALAAVQAAGVGTREDFYWTLHAVFVKRHEHSVLFDQAFRMFFRKRAYLDKLLAMLSPQAPAAAPRAAAGRRAARAGGAVLRHERQEAAGGARDRARRAAHGVRPRGAAEEGLRADERGRDRAGQGRDQAAWCWRSTR